MGVPLPSEGVGIAGLLAGMHSSRDSTQGISAVLQHVFAADVQLQGGGQEEIDYQQLDAWLQQHVAQLRASATPDAAAASSSAAARPSLAQPGRLGPPEVVVDRDSVCGSFSYSSDGMIIESLGNFSSCRANVAVFKGRWMYECTVLTQGIQQIGWATLHCPFTAEEGVGDAADSYAVDGKRQRKWNVKPQPYGEPWVPGDVMGCALDLDAGTLTFYRNGVSMGIAYDHVRTMQPSLAYFPAVSLSQTERCCLNFGARPFVYPVQGYQPLQAPPSQAEQAAAAYCCACLGRLVRLAAERQAGSSSSSGGGGQLDAAAAAGQPPAYSKGQDELQRGIAAAAAAPASPSPAVVAATAAERLGLGYPTSCSPRESSSGSWCPAALTAAASGAALSSADVVLLAAVLLEPLQQQLVLQPYLAHSTLLPLLLELQREGEATGQQRPLQLLLQLALLVWQQHGFASIVMVLLEQLGYRCQVSPLLAQDFPNTAGYPHLALAVSLLHNPAVMRLFVAHPDFSVVLEGLLARKSPSPKDLQVLLPHVWWSGCKDETASEERLKASVSIITATLSKVEQCQCELMELLLATPFQQSSSTGDNCGSGSSGGSSSTEPVGDCALMVFLRFLLQKNRGALRDVQPPGLSEPTVIMSTFFGLLRLLQPALHAAQEHGAGPLAAFPAAELLAGSGPSTEALPVFDAPRLGGTISHLAREHPVSELEQQPVQVQVQQQQSQQVGGGGSSYAALPALRDAWVPELLNSCMLLYAWRVGFNYKMIHSLSSSVASSSATLDELDRMIAASSEAGDALQSSSWLLGTRKVYREELTRDVRLLTLLRAAFFSPAKQAALSSLSRYLAMLLANVADIPAPAETAKAVAGAAAAGEAGEQLAGDGMQGVGSGSSTASASASGSAGAAGSRGSGSSSDNDDQSHLSNLLRYVPVVYVEVIVDYLTALRRLDEQQQGAASTHAQPAGACAYVAWLCGCLNDPRIATPDVQESLLQVVGLLLDHPGWQSVLEGQPARARQLLTALLVTFDSRLWHPTSGVILKVIKGSGFGHAAWPGARPPPGSLQQVMLDLLEEGAATAAVAAAGGSSSPSAVALPATAAAAAARVRGFFNRLFNTLNWTLTEFSVSVDDLHTLRGRRSILEAQNQYRRTGLMFELSVNFLLILEFVTPTNAFLSSSVNRTRLRELLQFALSHFTNGPDAHRLNELLHASQAPAAAGSSGTAAAAGGAAAAGAGGGVSGQPRAGASLAATVPAYAASAMRFESSSLSERVQKPALLAPLMGILLAAWDAHNAAAVAAAGGSAAVGAGTDVLGELVEMADERFMNSLRFLQDVDWSAAFPDTAPLASLHLSASLRAFGELLDALASARAAHESAVASQALPEDVPDEFTDPITMDIMRDPVRLPDSQIVVDRSTIDRHLLSSETDPFSRAPLKLEQLLPDEELKARIQQWLGKFQQQPQQQQQQHQEAGEEEEQQQQQQQQQ